MKKSSLKIVFYALVAVIVFIFGILGYGYYRLNRNFQAASVEGRERALAIDLDVMRKSIKQYSRDKNAPPQSMKDLVTAGYVPVIPPDPITNAPDWQVIYGEYESSAKTVLKGIVDIRSASPQKSSTGKPYNQW